MKNTEIYTNGAVHRKLTKFMILFLLLLKTPRLMISAALNFSGILFVLLFFSFTIPGDALFYLHNAQVLCVWMLLFNLYLAYEYVHTIQKSGLEETILSHKRERVELYGIIIVVLALLVFFQFILMFIFPIIIAAMTKMQFDFFAHIMAVTVLNTLLAGLLAVLFGVFMGMKFERVKAYSLMAILLFLILPASDSVPAILNDSYHINLWPVKVIFSNIIPPGQNWTIDYQYGICIEPIRWNLIVFWGALFCCCIFLCIPVMKRRTRIISILLSGVIIVGNLCGYIQGGSRIDLTETPNSTFRTDQVYYRHHEPKEEKAEFAITKYDMNIDISRELKASVKMELESLEILTEYRFTLYHLYKVSSVKDETGTELLYSQEGDYLDVYPSGALNCIIIEYSGYSPMFYSNKQGTCLPGCFPFYPWAGYRQIYYATPDPEEGFLSFIPRTDLPEAEFVVRLSGADNIKTNLEQKDGIFQGRSNALSFMGGFLEEDVTEKYYFVACHSSAAGFRLNDAFLDELQAEIPVLEQELGYESFSDLKEYKIFQVNETMLNRCGYGLAVPFDDHIFIAAYPDVQNVAYAVTYLVHEGAPLTVEDKLISEGVA